MPDLLPLGRPVYRRGFEKFGIDPRYGRKVNDDVVARVFPHVEEDKNERPITRLTVPFDGVDTQRLQYTGVEEPLVYAEQRIRQIAYDNP